MIWHNAMGQRPVAVCNLVVDRHLGLSLVHVADLGLRYIVRGPFWSFSAVCTHNLEVHVIQSRTRGVRNVLRLDNAAADQLMSQILPKRLSRFPMVIGVVCAVPNIRTYIR